MPQITKEKPAVSATRIRVQAMEGNKPTKTESVTLYGASADEVFKALNGFLDTWIAEKNKAAK